MEAINTQVGVFIEEGNRFIQEFTTTYVEGEVLLKEIQTLVPLWKFNEARCWEIVFQVQEVEKYGVIKFLAENPIKIVDSCMLFILKNNMG